MDKIEFYLWHEIVKFHYSLSWQWYQLSHLILNILLLLVTYFTALLFCIFLVDVCFQMTAFMCGGYMISWTPYAILGLCYVFDPTIDIPLILTAAAPFCGKGYTIINPIIYYFANRKCPQSTILCGACDCMGSDDKSETANTRISMENQGSSSQGASDYEPIVTQTHMNNNSQTLSGTPV